ncbi:MAG: hypothetical protein WD357_06400 [Gracilimonas sp.]
MPHISRIMIRLSLVYLLIGVSIGALMLVNKAFLISPVIWFIFPIHIEFLIFGWIIQFTLGVAYWILPRFLKTKGRGSKILARLMPLFLNIGIISVAFSGYGLGSEFALAGRILEACAVGMFVYLHWSRVVTYNK